MKPTQIVLATLIFAACGSSEPTPRAPAAEAEPTPAPQTFDDQAARGATLYGQHCAGCHGADGSGTDKAPPVVGPSALPLEPPPGARVRDVRFETALDVFKWVKANMPAGDPGSLTDDQVVAILAFDLKANGVKLDAPLDAENAATLKLH